MSKSKSQRTSHMNIKIPTGQDDYVDKRTGTTWKYFASLKSEEELGPFLKKHWLYRNRMHPNTIICRCSRNRLQTNGKENCEFRAVFLKANCKVYTKGEHNHPIYDREYSEASLISMSKMGKRQNWIPFCSIRDEQHLMEICDQQWLRPQYNGNTYFKCRKYCSKKCQFRAMYDKEHESLFVVGEHNHDINAEGKAETFVTRRGNKFRIFLRNLHNEKKLKEFTRQQMLIHCKTFEKTKLRTETFTAYFCPRDNKHEELRCRFHGRYYPEFGNFYISGEHNHPIVRIKKGRPPKESKNVQKGKFSEHNSDSNEEEEDEETEDEYTSEEEEEGSEVEDSDSEVDQEQEDEHFHDEEGNEVAEENQIIDGNFPGNKQQNGNDPDNTPELLEVQIVDEVNRQEYKMLPPMKRECDQNNAGPKQWPTVTIDSEVAGWQWQQTRSQKEALLRPVKKEEPEDVEEQPAKVPLPNQPTTSNANNLNPPANPHVGQHKMYLRVRKPVNYAEN